MDDGAGVSRPLFTARVSRLRANYTFTARSFVRLIGQYVSTDRDPALFARPTPAHDGFFSGSVLFAYKINWQSVMFVGYGDDRDARRAAPAPESRTARSSSSCPTRSSDNAG